ncbi:MAG: PAS domain S-box protein [Gammaproteobacteria bacterium]|nr:PAS domain S-box protein [Gammaproteobacteria bacterium]
MKKKHPQWRSSPALTGGGPILDMASIIKASQSIAGEIVMDRLLAGIMKTVIENTEAQKSFLLLEKHGKWVVEAEGNADKREDIKVLHSQPPEQCEEISLAVFRHVARTQEQVVLHDAANAGNFTQDPRIETRKSKSILCMPLLYQGKLSGVLYLENNLTAHAFTPDRIQILEILAAQAAVSLENARNYDELKRVNLSLQREIAERGQAEQALRESEKRFRQLVEQAADALFVLDRKGWLLDVNRCACDSLGYTREELLNFQITDIEMNIHAKKLAAIWKKLKSGGPVLVEGIHRRKDGFTFPVEVRVGLIESGESSLMLALARDISERKRSMETVARLGQILEHSLNEIYIFDANTFKFIQANKGARENLGYSMTELLRLTPLDLQPEFTPESFEEMIAPLRTGERQRIQFTTVHRRKDRSLYDVEVYLQLSRMETSPVFVAIILDVTKRSQAEAALKKRGHELRAKKAAEKANRAKSEFLANMSHEIRTPLNSILGFGQILKRDASLNPSQQEAVYNIHQSGEHLLTLINDILDLSKIEAGKMDLHSGEFHFSAFLKGVVEIMQIRARQKNIYCNLEAEKVLPTAVKGDETRLRQVLINLLGNAVKFTLRGGVVLKVSCEKTGTVPGPVLPPRQPAPANGKKSARLPPLPAKEHCKGWKVRFHVEDTGPGIAQQHLDNIFLPFRQIDGLRDAGSEGTGLGLPISKRLVEMMGGALNVNSDLGQGSIFWFDLVLPEIGAGFPSPPKKRITGFKGKSCRILLVEDNITNSTVLLHSLTPLGFTVEVAVNGREGIKKALAIRPDVIVMDLMMPVMNGFEAAREIRQTPMLQDLPIIATSASAFERHRAESLAAGCNAFIAKPIRIAELQENLQKLLKLKWLYETREGAKAKTADKPKAAMIAPPKETILALRELAAAGDVKAIKKQAARLERMHGKYAPFAAELRRLAESFQMRLLKRFIEKNQYEL